MPLRSSLALVVAIALTAASPAPSWAGKARSSAAKTATQKTQKAKAKSKAAAKTAPKSSQSSATSGGKIREKVAKLAPTRLRSSKPNPLVKREPVRERQREVANFIARGEHTKAARAVVRSLLQGKDGKFQKGGIKSSKMTMRESFAMWRSARKVYKEARKLAVKRAKNNDRQGVNDSVEALSTLNAAGRLGLVSRIRANRAIARSERALKNAPRKQMVRSVKGGDGETALAMAAEARQQPMGFWSRQLARVKMDKQNRAERKAVRIAKRRANKALEQGDVETAMALGDFIYNVRGDTRLGRAKLRKLSKAAQKLAKNYAEQGQTGNAEQAIELAAAFSAAGTKRYDSKGNPIVDNKTNDFKHQPKFTLDGKEANKIRARSGNIEWRQRIKAAKNAPPQLAAAHLARARQIETELGNFFKPPRFRFYRTRQGRMEKTLGKTFLDAKAELARQSETGEQSGVPTVGPRMTERERNIALANGEEVY